MQVEEVSEDKPPRTDSGQEESVPVGEEVKDDTVEPVTLEEESVAAKRHTSERAKNQTAVQESLTSNNEVNIQKTSPEEGTPIITSRSLRQRIVTVQGSPQRKSKRFQKSKMEIAENEHVVVVEVTDKTDESRTEETEENKKTTNDSYLKEVEIRIEDGSQDETTGDSVKITVVDVAEVGKDIEPEVEGKPQREEEEELNKTSISEKEDALTEIGVGEPITEGLIEQATEPSADRLTKDIEETIQENVPEEKTPVITSRSLRQRTVMVTSTPQRKSNKKVAEIGQNIDEEMVTEISSKSNDEDKTTEGQVEVDKAGKMSYTLQEIPEIEATKDKEDASQNETIREVVKITVVDMAEEGEGEIKEQAIELCADSDTLVIDSSEQGVSMQTKGEDNRIGDTSLNKESTAEMVIETSKVYTREDQEVLESDHGETVQESVLEEETSVIPSRSLRRRTVMVTSTPQRSKSKHLQKKEGVLVTEQIEDSIAETDQSKDEKMKAEVSSRSNNGDRAPRGQVEVVDKEEIVKVYTYQEISTTESSQADETQEELPAELDAFADTGVAEPIKDALLEQAIETGGDAHILIIDSGEQKQSTQTEDTDNTSGETSLYEESISVVAKETVMVYTSEIPEVLEPDHGETVQEIVPEEMTSAVTSRSLRRRTVMVTSTPQRSKSKNLQKTKVALVTEKNKGRTAETNQSKDEKMEAEFSFKSNDGDRAPEDQMEVVDEEAVVVSYTPQVIPTSESSQADESAVTETYLTEGVKDAGHTAQEELPTELIEEHHLEPVIEISPGQGGQKDI
ncbi:hypothetical protein AMEX_G25481, partial [Astyanax mexicanus]